MAFMTLQEETALVLDDVFIGVETEMMNVILDKFFQSHNIYMFDLSDNEEWSDKMNELVIEEQDELEEVRDHVMSDLFS